MIGSIGAGLAGLSMVGINPLALGGIVAGYAFLKMKPKEQNNKLAKNEFKKHLKGLEGRGGLPLAKHIILSPKACQEGVIIFAPTGEGKTTSIFVPALLDEEIEGSIIVPDPKGELYRLTSHFQESVCKRKVYVYAPFIPLNSHQYNILTECRTVTDIKQLAQNLLMNGALSLEIQTGKKASGIEWLQMGESLLSSALILIKSKPYPFNTIERALQLLISTDSKSLDLIFKNAPVDAQREFNVFKSVAGADRTEGSIKITLSSNMSLFNDPTVVQTMKKTDFTAEKLRKEKSIVYVIYPPYRAAYVSPLMASMYSQIITQAMECFKDDSLPLWIMGDEFCNIGQLQNFSQVISTVRHYNIKMVLCAQNLSQLFQLYGKENTNTILNNAKTKVILPSLTDRETLDYLSNLLGNKEITVQNESRTKESTTFSLNKQAVRFMDASEIRQMDKDSLIIIAHNQAPVKADQNIWYKDIKYMEKVQERELPII
jgi:type IV secretion system protein VirD4